MKRFINKKILIVSILFLLSEIFLFKTIVDNWKSKKNYTYETSGVIYFIGLPDGTVFVSCYDENNILHHVTIQNLSIRGGGSSREEPKYIESFYGKEIQILLNSETDRAISVSDYKKSFRNNLFLITFVLMVYLVIVLFSYKRYKKKKYRNFESNS